MSKLEKNTLIAVSLLLAIGFSLVGVLCFWSDSEIWHIKIGGLQGDARADYDYWIKPLFLWFLGVLFRVSEVIGISYIDVGRWVFIINGLWLAFLGSRIVACTSQRKWLPYLYFITLCGSWIYLERGFRVRADLLASLFFMYFLYLTCLWNRSGDWTLTRIVSLLGIFVLTVLATPKASILYICFIPIWWHIYENTSDRYKIVFFNLVVFTGCVLAMISTFSESLFTTVLQHQNYLSESLVDSRGQWGLFRLYRFEHVFKFIIDNPHIVILVLAKIAWILRNWKTWVADRFSMRWDLSIFLLIPALLLFPNRSPFFICSITPVLLFLPFTGSKTYIDKVTILFDHRKKYIWIFVITVSMAAFVKVYLIAKYHNNDEQRLLYSVLRSVHTSIPNIRIYDPAGLSPSHTDIHYYLGPGDLKGNQISAEKIIEQAPEIILWGQRLEWIRSLLDPTFLYKYMDFEGNGVLIKGDVVEGWDVLKSNISDFQKLKVSQLLLHIKADPNASVFISSITHDYRKLPGVVFEFEDGTGFNQGADGVPVSRLLNVKYVHVPSAAHRLVIFQNKTKLLNEFSIKDLLRYDPEL